MTKAKAKKETKSEPKKKAIPGYVEAVTTARAMLNLPPMRDHKHYYE